MSLLVKRICIVSKRICICTFLLMSLFMKESLYREKNSDTLTNFIIFSAFGKKQIEDRRLRTAMLSRDCI